MYTKEQWANLIHTEPHKIGNLIGFKDLDKLHSEWLKGMLFRKKDWTLEAHRGSYKTTCLSLGNALLTVWQPNTSIGFFRKTDPDVKEIITQTSKILKSDLFQIMIEDLYPGVKFAFITDSASEILTTLPSTPRGAAQIVGLGIGTSVTGKHFDIVETDDIVNLKDRISRAERESTKIRYQELQNIKNRNGRFINTCTPWHKEDAVSLMPNVKKYDCYSTGLISEAKLRELRSSMSDSLFAANYELKHIADADAMFKEPAFTDDITAIYDGCAHLDAAYGGGDWTAYTVMKKTPDGLVAYGKAWHKHVDDCLRDIQFLHAKFRAGSISCERNADKGYLAKELTKMGFQVKTYQESMNKFVKISTYLRRDWNRIKWLNETDPEYMGQVLDYTEFAEHDDAPDSAASLIRSLDKGKLQVKTFKGGI